MSSEKTLHILFDGPPSQESGRFVECENSYGASVGVGTWKERSDGFWELVITERDIKMMYP